MATGTAVHDEGGTGCANCGALLTGRWCAACGQKVLEEDDRRFGHLLKQFSHELFHVDGNIPLPMLAYWLVAIRRVYRIGWTRALSSLAGWSAGLILVHLTVYRPVHFLLVFSAT